MDAPAGMLWISDTLVGTYGMGQTEIGRKCKIHKSYNCRAVMWTTSKCLHSICTTYVHLYTITPLFKFDRAVKSWLLFLHSQTMTVHSSPDLFNATHILFHRLLSPVSICVVLGHCLKNNKHDMLNKCCTKSHTAWWIPSINLHVSNSIFLRLVLKSGHGRCVQEENMRCEGGGCWIESHSFNDNYKLFCIW